MATSRQCDEHRVAYERDGEIIATAIVGDARVGVEIGPAARRRGGGGVSAKLDWPTSTPLAISIDASFDGSETQSWQDDSEGKLESRIAEVTARIVVAGEARFRRSLKEAEERAEQFRRWEEQRRQEEIARRNSELLEQLRASGDLLRQAEDLRVLIGRVRDAVINGAVRVDRATLDAWERWASAEADRLDPILSGQIMSHLAKGPAES